MIWERDGLVDRQALAKRCRTEDLTSPADILLESNLLTEADGALKFTPEGQARAELVIRHHRLDHLSAVGLLLGVTVQVHQRRPAFVIDVGQTSLVDAGVAGCADADQTDNQISPLKRAKVFSPFQTRVIVARLRLAQY